LNPLIATITTTIILANNLKPKKKKCIICYLPTKPGAATPSEVL
jgi:hypothetical protein